MKAGLLGPFPLNFDTIDGTVVAKGPGVFALGRTDALGRFCVSRVGRAEANLAERLRSFIGTDSSFKFRSYRESKDAFLKECELFHALKPPNNRVHPARPSGTGWTCPHCVVFEPVRIRRDGF